MADLTGFHMLYSTTGEAMRLAHYVSPWKLGGWLICKLVVMFLWVWLVVYLLNRWNLTPFKKEAKKKR